MDILSTILQPSLQLKDHNIVFSSMRYARLVLILIFPFASFGQSSIRPDSLPESQINIPIVISLKPFYALAEKNVATVFTSPDYPNGWVEADCATRYKYEFKRSPFKIQLTGSRLDLAFTGFYKIIGSTRACMKGTIVSPWSPSCRCGFDEGERKVNISFTGNFTLYKNYSLQSKIIRNEPKSLDKCEVCFWGQDVTASVLNGLKSELDASKKNMENQFGKMDLRPQMQKAWNMLSQLYSLPNVGYFSLNPKRLHMENIIAKNDMLNINIGITATPVISFTKPAKGPSALPDLSTQPSPKGFNIFLEAALQYDSLSTVMNNFLAKKRFELSEGLIKKHIVIEKTKVSGKPNGDMLIQVDFSGSFNGTAFFSGTPVYDANTKTIFVKDLDYDLQTKNLLLNTAKWLFSKKIRNEINKYTRFSLDEYYSSAATAINGWLNKEWTKGVRSAGALKDLKLVSVKALPDHLLVRSNCAGDLSILITDVNLNL